MMLRTISLGAATLFLWLAAGAALAGEFFEKDGIALRGYDPVSYFEENQPKLGVATHSHVYQGSKFYFSSADNRQKFIRDPQKYAPQFGGFCAYGAAQGYKVSTQPDAFAVVDGKLYLNYNREVQEMWSKDAPGNIARADEKWPEVAKSKQKD